MKDLLTRNPLFVFALESEASNLFEDKNILFVGVGKVNATYNLTKQIIEDRPSIIVNLGSAGSSKFGRESVINCTKFIQRDMDATKIGCKKYATPFSTDKEAVLNYGLEINFLEKGICGTGDNFEVEHQTDDYNVIDMEAYALAAVAKNENIPFLCLKYISDGADDSAADDWEVMVHKAANVLRRVLSEIEQNL